MPAINSPLLPLIEELQPAPDAEQAFRRLGHLPHVLFLDSAQRHSTLGRYSFVAADPFAFVEVPADGSDALAVLGSWLSRLTAATHPQAPPFQGGAAGLFSYDLGRSLERIPGTRFDEFNVPALAVGLFDVVVAFDHELSRAWLVSQGLPEVEPARRRARAARRLAEFRRTLAESTGSPCRTGRRPDRDGLGEPSDVRDSSAGIIPAAELAPQFPVPGLAGLTSNFTAEGYCATVQRAVDYIHAGDVFQVNLAQRLLHPATESSVELYRRLRNRNPAPFAAYFDAGEFQILSASPERFLQLRGTAVETRPIKGTRQRTHQAEADLFAADELRESEKDRAENVMIVDLLRNDLSRVCRPDSVRVTQLCELERYQFVQHLVSAVRGELAVGRTALDLLRAAFPGGSVTGAPKVRAMEIIAELEPTARGPYCGSLGYVGFDGTLDLSILIRTITAGRGWWQMPVGGGVVAQSHPEREYEETWHKATGLLRALP